MRFSKGFTLIELMIAAAVVAILAAIALPSYQDSVRKSNRKTVRVALLEVVAKQEQYFLNNKSYATDLTALGYPANGFYIDNEANKRASATGSIYQIAFSAASVSAFTLVATPQAGQASDSCAKLSITDTGLKSATGSGDCW